MGSELDDEIASINAIYAENTLSQLSSDANIYSLAIPGQSHIVLRLEIPVSYPDVPFAIVGTQSVGDNVAKGQGQQIVGISRSVLSQVYQPGTPCIFDLVEELQARLSELLSPVPEDQTNPQRGQGSGQHANVDLVTERSSDALQQSPSLLSEQPPWILSEVISEKKSVFIARAAAVHSTDEAKAYLYHLISTDKKVAKATHNITAWRIRGANDTAFQDCDDDGETAAGGRLLHLLQLMDVWDVMVVVTRWYGGIQLGPDRFRIINSVARDAVVKGQFDEVTKSETNKKRSKR